MVQDRLAPAWVSADFVLVNGEGTIHHNNVGAISLIAFCAAASRMRKRVVLVNCSVTHLDELMLGILHESVDYLSVREPITHRYLETNGIHSTLAADCLFLAQPFAAAVESAILRLPYPEPYVIYTPGVLAGSGPVNAQQIASDIAELRSQGDPVVYLTVESEDERLAASASSAGAKVLPLGFVRWDQMPTLLAGAKLVVSGRYHINIFAALAGVPFIPMETNTQKMQGVLELLSPDATVNVRSWGSSEISAGILDFELAFTAPPEAVARCGTLACNNLVLS
jgi:polysaccharide pyruvyl transferase WcaK-like protein